MKKPQCLYARSETEIFLIENGKQLDDGLGMPKSKGFLRSEKNFV
jgi:hypothetical protein